MDDSFLIFRYNVRRYLGKVNVVLINQLAYGNPRHFQLRNAEQSYRKNADYMNARKPSQTDLEDLLTGKKEFDLLRSGQVPLMIRKPGSSHEETITELENIRKEALSSLPPTTLDYRTAASATAKIREIRSQDMLDRVAETQIELAEATLDKNERSFSNEHSLSEQQTIQRRRKYELAASKYAYQAEMKRRGFQIEQPSFFRIA